MAKAKKTADLTVEERLEQALVPEGEQPYSVPENWCWTRIRCVSNFERGITFPASEKQDTLSDDNIPCLRTANIQETLEISDLIYVNKCFMKCNHAKYVQANDIIMSSANSRELVGKVSYVYSVEQPMTFGGFVLTIRANHINSKLLFYLLRLEFLSGRFMGESTQTTNIANINTSTLGNYCFPLPPLAEQQRIVDRIESLFAKLDEAKEKAQAALDSFETRKAAILHKAFTGELTAKWRKGNGVGRDSWKKVLAIDCLLSKPRNGYSPTPVSHPTKVKSLTLSATTSGEFKSEYFKYIDEKIAEDSYLWLKANDILIQRANSLEKVGSSAIYLGADNEFIYPDLMMKLQVNATMVPKFLAYQLKTERVMEYLRNNATGTAGNMPKINQGVVSNIPLYRPTKCEQTEIVSILENFFAKEQKAKELCSVLDNIDLIKKSILARAFRGELGTNDPTEESALELLKSIV